MISIIPFARFSGSYNMELDLSLFKDMEKQASKPVLRLYGWKAPCISLGYSQEPKDEVHLDRCRKKGIEVVKRPTGGGIVFHNEYELTYSLVCDIGHPGLPNGLISSYKAISGRIIEALRSSGIPAKMSDSRENEQARLCFSFPASYEITLKGHKIVGSAQKRGKKALLQQGSIFVRNSSLKASDFIRNAQEFISIEEVIGRNLNRGSLQNALVREFSSF